MARRRLFILGAGASYAAGLPDGGTLLGHLFGYGGGAPWEVVYNRPPDEYWAPLLPELYTVMEELYGGTPQSRWPLDELFGRFWARLRRQPMEFLPVMNLLHEATAQLLYTRSLVGGTSEAYERFVAALQPGDVILTFNWDTCPEIALNEQGCSFSLAPAGPAPDDRPWILKLHGSIDYLILRDSGHNRQMDFLDWFGVVPPSPFAGEAFALARLRTYDLGYPVELEFGGRTYGRPPDGERHAVLGGFDVGPFTLTSELDELPTYHMLTPDSPKALYGWQYKLVLDALRPVCSEIEHVYVVGYSFPRYDRPVHQVLRTIHRRANRPPVAVVNPSAADLPGRVMHDIFGEYELRPLGFAEADFSEPT